ncbi:MAG TPA: amidohydrolase family protein [Gemmatimonadaceae bacterium]|nr:amidohydrolase family protein [Gemmatimonadaceae bacterium]
MTLFPRAGAAFTARCPARATLTLLAAATLLPLGAGTAAAQLGSYNAPPGPAGVYAIRNARLVVVSGPTIENGTIVIGRDGRIQALGANVPVPADAQTIDGTGMTVYPGMMDAGTTLGLAEIPQGAAATMDVAELGSFNPNVQAFFGINPHSAHVGVTRVVGVTHVVSRPTGGILSGQAALINLAGDTPQQMALARSVALVVNLPRAGFAGRGFGGGGQAATSTQDAERMRARQLDSLRQMLRDAAAYATAHEAFAKDAALPRPARDVVLAALGPAMRGEVPVIFTADRAGDIRAALDFARDEKLKAIILGGREAPAVAERLRQQDVPVVLTEVLALPSREDDPYDVNFSTPATLAAAGVRFAISSGNDGSSARDLPYVAGMAAAFGLSKEEALKAVTLYPAQIFGVGDQLGSLQVGKVANLAVLTGDMLEATSDTKALFVGGRPVPLSSKHTYLNEMFKDRP